MGTETGALVDALRAYIPELRGSEFEEKIRFVSPDHPGWREEMRSPEIEARLRKPLASTVPIGAGIQKEDTLSCDRRVDPKCISVQIGKEVYRHPGLLERIEYAIRHICDTIPVPTEPYPGRWDIPKADVKQLRYWAGCDGAMRERRVVVLYVRKDIDRLTWPGVSLSEIRDSVVERRILYINE